MGRRAPMRRPTISSWWRNTTNRSTRLRYFSVPNVTRKMNAGGIIPLYAAPGLDVSKELLAMLQEDSKKDQ